MKTIIRLFAFVYLFTPAFAFAQFSNPLRIQEEGTTLAVRSFFNCVGAGITCAIGSSTQYSVTVAAGAGGTLQTAYDNSAGASPSILLTAANAAVTIRDAGAPAQLAGNLFGVFDSAGTTTYFGVSAAGVYHFAGTSALPGISFAAETDSGLYRPAANQIAQTVNGGTDVFTWSNTALTASGVNAAGTITFSSGSGLQLTWGAGTFAVVNGGVTINPVVTSYNSETTAGVGIPYIEAVGLDVASSGAGAQSTTIATYTPPAASGGVYRVAAVASCSVNDASITVVVTFTDAVDAQAVTRTLISAYSCTANGDADNTSGEVLIRANNSSAILLKITASGQATTKVSGQIERLQ